ncbi:RNA-guided endonuclease InsQ/TnpB family protein [Thermus neutrinimicus]|uniref:RNA-guided endonuclease InsQ/TnpB family protein n=1 Tax=Thermus neutrinimicus TaxID=2908149 RepID=UPI001FAB1CF7|nr:helix-turn-helix domain-containing protein [Thermus neutrinimicus]
MTRKAFKYRLYPTKPQTRDLERTLELCRQLYNSALQERRDTYRRAGQRVTFSQQSRYLPQIREELPEYKKVHSQVLQEVLHRVDRAFQGFFFGAPTPNEPSPGEEGTETRLPPLQGEGTLRLLHLSSGWS